MYSTSDTNTKTKTLTLLKINFFFIELHLFITILSDQDFELNSGKSTKRLSEIKTKMQFTVHLFLSCKQKFYQGQKNEATSKGICFKYI